MRTVEGKVVVLGSQGVGKTSMITRYVGKMFSQHASPTIGASFFTCKVNLEDARIKLQVWDTAGQERFRSMAPMYYRNANAALLVFDLTQYNTFTEIKTWVTELQRNIDEALVLVLVGNKSDLIDRRTVDPEEGRKYATKIGASYHETSALHDEGIEQVFLAAALGLLRGHYLRARNRSDTGAMLTLQGKTRVAITTLSTGNEDVSTSLRIYDSTTSSGLSSPEILQHAPSSEESLANTSIAHGIHERPPACC